MKIIFYLLIIFQFPILFRVQANKLIADLVHEKSLKWDKHNDKNEKINKTVFMIEIIQPPQTLNP